LQTKLTSIEQILHSQKEDVIAVLGSKEIELWNLTKRTKIRSLVGPLGYYQKITLSPDQRTLAASANRLPAQGQIAIWNIAEGRLLKTVENPNGKLKIAGPLLFTSNGTKLLVGAQGGVIIIDAVSGKLEREIVAHAQGEIHSMALSADGRSLAVSFSRSPSESSISSEISVLDLVTYRQSALLSGVAMFPNSLIYSLDGSQLLAGSGTVGSQGHLQIWRTTDWRKWFDDVIHVDRILSMQYSVEGTLLVSVDGSGFIKYWRLKSLQ
jgi:WD40 repeat protein